MIFNHIIDLLETQTEKLTKHWCEEINKSDLTPAYHRLSTEELVYRHVRVVRLLGKWLERKVTRVEVGRFFFDLGQERYGDGVPLCEVNYAFLLAKRGIWNLIHSEGVFSNALEVYQTLDLITSVHQFFDWGNFYIIRGYLATMSRRIGESAKFSEAELQQYFLPGSF